MVVHRTWCIVLLLASQSPIVLPAAIVAAATNPASVPTTTSTQAGNADDDWIGGAISKTGAPEITGKSFAGDKIDDNGAAVTPVTFEAVAEVVMSSDGKWAYILHGPNTLSKVSIPDLKEERNCTLPGKPTAIGMSRQGIVVTAATAHAMYLFDDKLEMKRSVTLDAVSSLAASPAIDSVFIRITDERLATVDSATGKVTEFSAKDLRVKAANLKAASLGFQLFNITPDGTFLICEGQSQLHRLRIGKETLTYEDSGPQLGSNPQSVAVSGDSRYLALPCGGGNTGAGSEVNGAYSTLLFRIDDLKKSVCTIPGGAYPRTVGFDVKSHLIFVQNHDVALLVYTAAGVLKAGYRLGGNVKTDRFYVHPDGQKLFVKADGKLFWVELP
jgi:hypothetical protein